MTDYKLMETDTVIRVVDNATIPNDQGNIDRQQYEAWLAAGNIPHPYTAPSPTIADVISERERRLSLGFDYDFGDARGIHHIGTTDQDMKGWDEVTKVANAMLAFGDRTSTIAIVTNTSPVTVTAMDWQGVLIAAGRFRQPIWQASFVLQATVPLPDDVTANQYWP